MRSGSISSLTLWNRGWSHVENIRRNASKPFGLHRYSEVSFPRITAHHIRSVRWSFDGHSRGSDGSGGLTGMFNNIAESINYVSSTVRANLATSLGTVSQGIQNNTETIGARIAVLIEDITTLVVKFLEWLPTIVMVTKALVTLFLVAKGPIVHLWHVDRYLWDI